MGTPRLLSTVAALHAELASLRAEGAELASLRAGGATIGFVPTMGFLHAGHRSLMAAARARHDVVVVSIFVNPLQFGPHEDLDAYPRDLDGDLAACAAEGVDLVFAPSTAEVYPRPMTTTVHVGGLTDRMCGAGRPGHFDGVATVVTKLFSIVGPCTAYFGRKDFQQLLVVRRVVDDLSLPVDVVGCPLVREPDGMAMSSRNAYLSDDDRRRARVLSRALLRAGHAVEAGERDPRALRDLVVGEVRGEPGVELEYAEVVSADDLSPVTELRGPVVVAVAARVGATRLIDNLTVRVDDDHVVVDAGVTGDATADTVGIGSGS